MTRPERPRPRSPRRPIAVAAIGAVILTTTVYGTFASAVIPSRGGVFVSSPGSVGSGTLSLMMHERGSGLTQRIAGLAPGDTVLRYVDVASAGSLIGDGVSVQLAARDLTAAGASSPGLRAQVSLCDSSPWQPTSGTCPGGGVELLAATPVTGLSAPHALPAGRLTPGRVLHLRLSLHLPDQDETTSQGVLPDGTVQGRQALLTWTFSTRQVT